ncbi:MAG TPA: hypothetical protein VLG40_01995 [Candidatus Saccharimonas sp.]|nr:hypothetical protein [Candidatus Saccharimonas sp.]
MQKFFLFAVAALAIVCSFLLCYNIRRGNPWWAAAMVWLASPVPILVVGVGMEHRNALDMLNPAKQALSALFGDLLVLPVVVWLLAYAVKRSSDTAFTQGYGWLWIGCHVVGQISGLLFHAYDSPHYTWLAINSPGKDMHDYLAWVAILAGLLFGFITVLRKRETRKLGVAALGVFAVFVLLMVFDTAAPHWHTPLHVQYDWTTGKVIPYEQYDRDSGTMVPIQS